MYDKIVRQATAGVGRPPPPGEQALPRTWLPLAAMAAGVRWIGYLLPLTYFTMISQGIMLRGAAITALWLPFVVLAGMAVVVFTGATLRFRRDLAPGSPARPPREQPTAAEAVSTA